MNVLEYGKLKMEDRMAVENQEEAMLSYSIRGYHVYRKQTCLVYLRHYLMFHGILLKLHADSIESSWGLFKDLFFTAVDSFVPKLRWRLKKFKHWFTYDTIHLIRKKRRLYLQLKKKDSATLLTEYKQLRNKVRYLTRLETRKYSESLSNQYVSNPRKFWSWINSSKGRRNPIPPLRSDGCSVTDQGRCI